MLALEDIEGVTTSNALGRVLNDNLSRARRDRDARLIRANNISMIQLLTLISGLIMLSFPSVFLCSQENK